MNILKRYKYLLAGTAVCLAGFSAVVRLNAAQAPSERTDKAQFLTQLIAYMLGQWHYSPKPVDDSLSVAVYEEYLKTLDFGKRYFTQADSVLLERYRYDIDDQVLAGDTAFFHSATSIFKDRTAMVAGALDSIMASPMDFSLRESLCMDDSLYARDMEQVLDRWRKYLKYNVLTRLYADLKTEDDKAAKDSTYVRKTTAELEAKARESVLKNYRDYFKRIDELDNEDWFSMYLNALTMYFDPHTPVHGSARGKKLQHQHFRTIGRHRRRTATKRRLCVHHEHFPRFAGSEKRTVGRRRPDTGGGSGQ